MTSNLHAALRRDDPVLPYLEGIVVRAARFALAPLLAVIVLFDVPRIGHGPLSLLARWSGSAFVLAHGQRLAFLCVGSVLAWHAVPLLFDLLRFRRAYGRLPQNEEELSGFCALWDDGTYGASAMGERQR